MHDEDDPDESRRVVPQSTKKQPATRGKVNAKAIVQKGRQTRGRKQVQSESESEDEFEKENPKRGGRKAKQRVVESDSDDEPMPRKVSQATARKTPIRASRSNRSKVIEELSTSGENVLRENNSFEI